MAPLGAMAVALDKAAWYSARLAVEPRQCGSADPSAGVPIFDAIEPGFGRWLWACSLSFCDAKQRFNCISR